MLLYSSLNFSSHGLKHVLLAGIYLSLVTFPATSSAPANLKEMATSRRETPPWFNPCGNYEEETSHGPQTVDDEVLLTRLTHQISITQGYANSFKGKYVQQTFNLKNTDDIDGLLKGQDFDWLPTASDIPIGLDEKVSEEHLNSLQLEKVSVDLYKHFQTISAGLEQMKADHRDNPELSQYLNEQEDFLRMVLCEIQSMIIEHNMKRHKNVDRDVIPSEARVGDMTQKNMRGWLIFRSYLTTLQYADQVFNYFLKQKSQH